MSPKTILSWAIGITLSYLGLVFGLVWWVGGIIRPSNYGSPIGLLIAFVNLALWVFGAAGMGCSIYNAWRKYYPLMFSCCAAAVLLLASTYAIRPISAIVAGRRERQDLKHIDLHALRAEAAALVAEQEAKDYPFRWFGGEIPADRIPPTIKSLARNAGYVTASEVGVVMVVDGMGGWRGGYMITPLGSMVVPKLSRFIAAGVFYVIEQ